MLTQGLSPFSIILTEECGIAHDLQIVEVAVAPNAPSIFAMEDTTTQRRFWVQRSQQNTDRGFLLVSLAPHEVLTLVSADKETRLDNYLESVQVESHSPEAMVVSNGQLSVRLTMGHSEVSAKTFFMPGPIQQWKVGNRPWRGRTFFDTRQAIESYDSELVEQGPLRVVQRYRVRMSDGHSYESQVTLDAHQDHVLVSETFQGGVADQLIWDFAGDDLPNELVLLDSTPGYSKRKLHYHSDLRHARLACWTQFTQLSDFSDGYALTFANDDDITGFVALEGGAWRGARLNHLEAWTRRWIGDDPATRRDVPPDAKADSIPSPERIPARGHSMGSPHFSVEGWIGQGHREFALVLTPYAAIRPESLYQDQITPQGCSPDRGHFELLPDRVRYAREHSRLRQIHTQRGQMPLSLLTQTAFSWPQEAISERPYPEKLVKNHLGVVAGKTPQEQAQWLITFLEARVFGYWERSGSAHTNPVVSRPVAPAMELFEWLQTQHVFTEEQIRTCRAHFAFLMALFASDNYYPGMATMQPLGLPETTEPTLMGMANQNFYTDVINVFGMGAQVFEAHPMAHQWRTDFLRLWHQQLAYHVYPDSGVWEESHTYYLHVLLTVLPTLVRRREDRVDNEFSNPAFQTMAAAALKQLTPPDASFEGLRHLVAIGDHSAEPRHYKYVFWNLADGFALVNPRLAGEFCWAYREMAGTDALSIEPIARDWQNEHLSGLGVMFRGTDTHGHQSLLALRSGTAWGHHHNDEGCIQFFAKGRSLIVDSAFGDNQDDGKKASAFGHSRWLPNEVEPMNYLWRFARGWVVEQDLGSEYAFAAAYDPTVLAITTPSGFKILPEAIEHFRTIVQLSPLVFLIVDTCPIPTSQRLLFHVPGNDVTRTHDAGMIVRSAGNDLPDCRLQFMPLTPGEFATGLPTSIPSTSGKLTADSRFLTTEIQYRAGTTTLAAFLVAVDSEEEPTVIRADGDAWTVVGSETNTRIAFTTNDVLLTNLSTGHERSIVLRRNVT